MTTKNRIPLVWRGIATLLITTLAVFIPACALTPGQQTSALVQAGGQA